MNFKAALYSSLTTAAIIGAVTIWSLYPVVRTYVLYLATTGTLWGLFYIWFNNTPSYTTDPGPY